MNYTFYSHISVLRAAVLLDFTFVVHVFGLRYAIMPFLLLTLPCQWFVTLI